MVRSNGDGAQRGGETYAPSPTITSFLRISAMFRSLGVIVEKGIGGEETVWCKGWRGDGTRLDDGR